MAKTKIEDVLDPEVIGAKVETHFPDKVAFLNSGASAQGGTDINKGGSFLTIPGWKRSADEMDDIDEDSGLTPRKVESQEEIGVIVRRGAAYEVSDVASLVSLDDPNQEVSDQLIVQAGRTIDRTYINTAIGAELVANTYAPGVAEGTKVKIAAEHVIAALLLQGDELDDLNTIIMHSVPYGDLLVEQLIDFIPAADGKGRIPTYMGRRVILSDRCPVDTAGTNPIYTTFLVGSNAFLFDYQEGFAVEFDRDVLEGSDIIVARMHYMVHPYGMKWDGGKMPTKAQVKTTSNWSQVATSNKAIKLVALKTN